MQTDTKKSLQLLIVPQIGELKLYKRTRSLYQTNKLL